MAAESTARIVAVLRSIPPGKVTSYGRVAALAGLPGGARQVVRILHAMSRSEGLPWHRVLRADGSIALPEGGGAELQAALLEAEGVGLGPRRRVDLARYGWDGATGARTPGRGRPGPRRAGSRRG